MKKDQNLGGSGISNQHAHEPNSAHASRTVEKYVKKRREKAEKQAEEEHKSLWDWASIKYVIL